MERVVRFKANDGTEWALREQALERDSLTVRCDSAMRKLKPTPDDPNWEGFIQQDPDVVLRVKGELFAIANVEGILKWWIDRQKQDHGKTERTE